MPVELPRINRTEVDGIATYWLPVPGPLVANLAFRVGSVDETLPMAGVTHLVEHLALADLGQPAYDTNGFVEDTRTIFTASGTPDEVVGFLNHVVASLKELPLDRLAIERDILSSESAQREWSPMTALRVGRFGPRGFGLPASDPLGLDWLSADDVRAWTNRHFVRDGAVLWLSGPPPAGLSLELPSGTAPDMPTPVPVDDQPFPMQLKGPPDGLALGVIGPRMSGLGVGWRIAERALRARLRFQEGIIYDLVADYNPLTADLAEAVIGAQCRSDRVEYLRDAVLKELSRLAGEGPPVEEIRIEIDSYVRQFSDPYAGLGALDSVSADHLRGRFDSTPKEQYERLNSMRPNEVAAGVRSAMSSAVLVAPEELPITNGFHAEVMSSPRPLVTGSEFRPRGGLLRRPKGKLVVGPDGATIVLPEGTRSTVRYQAAAAVHHVNETTRVLIGFDNFRVWIDADVWQDGRKAISLVDAAAPRELVACPDHRGSWTTDTTRAAAGH